MTSGAVSTKKKDGGRIAGPAAVQNVIEVRCQIVLPNTKRSYFTFHGAYPSTPPAMQPLANTLFSSISSAWGTNLGSYMAAGPPATAFQNVYVRDMTVITNPVYVGTGTAVAGTSASPAMPPGAAIVMTEQINARGRGMKGRIYLGGWATNADAGGGVIAAAVQTAINAFGTAVLNALNTNIGQACVAQVARQQYTGITGTVHPARGTPGVGSHVQVNAYQCQDTLWDSQRRRAQL